MDLSSRFSNATVDAAISAQLLRDFPAQGQQERQFQDAFDATYMRNPHAFGAATEGHFGGQSDINISHGPRLKYEEDFAKQQQLQQAQAKMLSPSGYEIADGQPPVTFGLPLESLPPNRRKFVNAAPRDQHEAKPADDRTSPYVAAGPLATIQTSPGHWEPVLVPICTHPEGMSEGAHQKIQQIESKLRQNLGPEYVSERKGPGGKNLSYLEGWKAVDLANEIFGFSGWASRIMAMNVNYVMPPKNVKAAPGDVNSNNTCWKVGVHCIMRVTLRDGSFHEDVGFAEGNSPHRLDAYENGYKSASTDALKRALKHFGRGVGLCLNDADYRTFISKYEKEEKANKNLKPPTYDPKELLRDPSRRPPQQADVPEHANDNNPHPGHSHLDQAGPSYAEPSTVVQPANRAPPPHHHGQGDSGSKADRAAGGADGKEPPAAAPVAAKAVSVAPPSKATPAATREGKNLGATAPPAHPAVAPPTRAVSVAPRPIAQQSRPSVARSATMATKATSMQPTTADSLDDDAVMAACDATEEDLARAKAKGKVASPAKDLAPPSTPWGDLCEDELDIMEVACELEERKTSSGSSSTVNGQPKGAAAEAAAPLKRGAVDDDSGIALADASRSFGRTHAISTARQHTGPPPPHPARPAQSAVPPQRKPIGGFGVPRGSVSSLAATAAGQGARGPMQRSNTSAPSPEASSRSVSPSRPSGSTSTFATAASIVRGSDGVPGAVQGRSVNHGYVGGSGVGNSSTPLNQHTRGIKRPGPSTNSGPPPILRSQTSRPSGSAQYGGADSGRDPTGQRRQPLSPLRVDEGGTVKRPRN